MRALLRSGRYFALSVVAGIGLTRGPMIMPSTRLTREFRFRSRTSA